MTFQCRGSLRPWSGGSGPGGQGPDNRDKKFDAAVTNRR